MIFSSRNYKIFKENIKFCGRISEIYAIYDIGESDTVKRYNLIAEKLRMNGVIGFYSFATKRDLFSELVMYWNYVLDYVRFCKEFEENSKSFVGYDDIDDAYAGMIRLVKTEWLRVTSYVELKNAKYKLICSGKDFNKEMLEDTLRKLEESIDNEIAVDSLIFPVVLFKKDAEMI